MIFTMQGSSSVAANTTTENVLSGQRYERPAFNSFGNLYACGSASGLTAELNVGGQSVTPPVTVNAENKLPIVPDHILVGGWEAPAGSLVQVRVANTTAGALTFFWRVDLEVAE
jgi:hypothetical protein